LIMFVALNLTASTLSAQAGNAEKQVIQAMNAAAEQWNKGDLDGYMSLYDTTATMMLPKGRTKVNGMRELYEQYYFENGKPKQMLGYNTYEFTPLGNGYALLTGRFILKANEKMKERTGTFSLVFVHTANGWKILHDHSG
jgi:ketosteroid isomerase-like protein